MSKSLLKKQLKLNEKQLMLNSIATLTSSYGVFISADNKEGAIDIQKKIREIVEKL